MLRRVVLLRTDVSEELSDSFIAVIRIGELGTKLAVSASYFLSINYKLNKKKQTNSVAFSPQANYTDWGTDTCRRNFVPTSVDRGVSRGQRGGYPTVVNLSFLDRIINLTQSELWVNASCFRSCRSETTGMWSSMGNLMRLNKTAQIIKVNWSTNYINNVVFWDVTPCSSCKNWHFRETSSPLRPQTLQILNRLDPVAET
jgi:hypothetical protein